MENGGGDAQQFDKNSANSAARDDDRKLFVGGLNWQTTDKDLKNHFSQYGEIESVSVKVDVNTGRSRGFAFIVFKQAEAIEKVVAVPDHIVNNTKVDPRKVKAKNGKIFVGGLTSELSDEDVREHFGQYGTIVQLERPFDKLTNQKKGFCFITFESEQVANGILRNPKQNIKDKMVDVKRVTPKPDQMGGAMGAGRGRGGRGGSRGYGNQSYNQSYGSYGQGYGYDSYGTDYGYGGGYGSYGGNSGGYDYSNYGSNYGGAGGGGQRNQRHQPY